MSVYFLTSIVMCGARYGEYVTWNRIQPKDQIFALRVRPSADNSRYEHVCKLESLEKGWENIKALTAAKLPRFTQSWFEQDQVQRATPGKFWEGMRDRHRGTLQRLKFGEEDIESDLKVLSADSNPDHVQSFKAERDAIIAEIDSRNAEKESKTIDNAPIDIQTQWGHENQEMEERPEYKVKVKTRAATEVGERSTSSSSEMGEEIDIELVKISVSRGAFSIFQAMFLSPNNEGRTRVVKWDAFVNAMAEGEVGFVATQNAGGSTLILELNEASKWKGMGKIVFHKPHPSPEPDLIMSLSNKKRMGK